MVKKVLYQIPPSGFPLLICSQQQRMLWECRELRRTLSGSGMVLVQNEECQLVLKWQKGFYIVAACHSLILALFLGSCGYICALHGFLSSAAMLEIIQNHRIINHLELEGTHRIIDHLELEGTHNDHGSPTPVPAHWWSLDHPKNPTTCLRLLSKYFLNAGGRGAMTTSPGSLFQCPQTVAQDNDGCLSHCHTICPRVAHLGHFICPSNCYSSYPVS